MKRVVVFGSTSNEVHLGCKALTAGLDLLIRDKYSKEVEIQHISHRYLSTIFYKKLLKQKPKNILGNFFSNGISESLIIDNSFQNWLKALKEMSANDMFLNLTIKNSDSIVINVEGTIHHKALLGHQMLAIGRMASDLGKNVYWTNVSVEKENAEILKYALEPATLIAARESNSFDYLKSIGLNAVQAFDTALLAPEEENKSTIRFVPQKKYCLFTGSNIKKYDLLDIANTISDKGFSPIYIPLGLNDYEDFARLKKSNVDCFEFNELSYSELLEVIRNAEIVVSGRHHLNILSLAVAKPFVPLESNTWKIDGVCKMLGYRTQFDIDLSLRIDDVLLNKEAIICKFTNHSKTLMKLAKLNLT